MTILRDLKKIDKSVYDKAIENIVDKLEKSPSVSSVYMFGEIKFPGISDIDLLLVIKNSNYFDRKRKYILNVIKESSDFSEYLFYHDPIIITEEEFKYLKIFHSTNKLKHICGKKLEFFNIKNPFFVEVWNSFFLKTYLVEDKKRVLSERELLLIINNLAESIRYTVGEAAGNRFKQRVNTVRRDALMGKSTGEVEKKILADGIVLMGEHMPFLKKRSLFRNVIWDGRRSLFIAGDRLRIVKLLFINVYFYPKHYFDTLDKYKIFIKKFVKSHNLSLKDFFTMRKKFGSPPFLNF